MKRNDRIDRIDQVDFAKGVVRESRLKVAQLEREIAEASLWHFAVGLVIGVGVGLGLMLLGTIM